MESSVFSQIGRYGTLSLMKQHETDAIVTAFGIDTEELTFGRDPSCSIRLYYPEINLIHCKIVFEERKAFLVVLGTSGLSVDGCRVHPNPTAGGQPKTIPLSNNSEIEIHKKRFRFSYPPKEMRATLLATPSRNNRRLRLSMIHSAQVFSPRPSKDPKENLKILKSPMKNAFRSPMKPSALSGPSITSPEHDENSSVAEEEEEEEAIVLVDGNHPRVVEEDKDLVILEDIEMPEAQPVGQVQPPKTPQRRRSQSLHRAVLIRSAQRAIVENERKRRQEEEEWEEEREVLDTIAHDEVSSDEEAHVNQRPGDSDEEMDSDENEEESNQDRRKSLWRKSFERLWPFRSSSPTGAEDEATEHNDPEECSEEAEEEREAYDQPGLLPALAQATPVRRPQGSFMTPQVSSKSNLFGPEQGHETPRGRLGGGPPVRHSIGGEPRRVPLETAWRVKDLVVPLKDRTSTLEPSGEGVRSSRTGTPRRSYLLGQTQASPVRPHSEVSAEERKAIQDRRRSALREVDSHSYFSGGIPGMSPTKAATSPVKPGFNDANNPFQPVSPTKGISLPHMVKDIERRLSTDEEDEKLDTRSLLERMKETVEGMKSRRSTLGLPASSPSKPGPSMDIFNDIAQPIFDDAEKENDEDAMDVDPEPVVLLRPSSKKSTERPVEEEPRETVFDEGPVVPTHVEETNTQSQQQENMAQSIVETSQPEASRSRSRNRSPHAPLEVYETTTRRSRKATAELEETEDNPEPDAPKRNTRKATRATEPSATTAIARTRRVREPTAEPEEPRVAARRGRKTPTVEEKLAPVPQRNSRKATVKEETGDDAEDLKTLPARRGRAPKGNNPEKGVNDTGKHTTTRTRGAKASIQVDQDGGDDPLDSLNASEEAQTKTDALPPIPTKAATGARKTRTVVKQEDSTNEVLKSSTRSRKATDSTAAETHAPTRGRSRKTTATASSSTQEDVDKENEPRNQSRPRPANKNTSVETEDRTAVRVRTARKARTVPVKQETVDTTAAAPPRAQATRTTRARTRTT